MEAMDLRSERHHVLMHHAAEDGVAALSKYSQPTSSIA